MVRNQPAAYYGLLALSIALSVLAVITLIPNPAASKPNVLGYRSVCSFAPAGTAVLGLCAGLACTLRARLVSRNAKSARFRPLVLPVGIGVLLFAVVVVFGAMFLAAQARFQAIIQRTPAAPAAAAAANTLAEGTRSATISDGEISATVRVTVSAGRIDGLELTAGRNVDEALARRLFDEVRAAQSVKVDAVSGATASSRVLLSAIEEALRRSR